MGKENGDNLKKIKSLKDKISELDKSIVQLGEKNLEMRKQKLKLAQENITLKEELFECRKKLKEPQTIDEYLKVHLDEEKRIQKEKPNE
jgi:regulator of replication initiation timing